MNKMKAEEIALSLNIIDDTLFQKMAEDKGFCEELRSFCDTRCIMCYGKWKTV